MISKISFGTSGHRGIIGSSFTVEQVTAICQAIATVLKKDSPNPKVLIGYDPREGNDPACKEGSFTHAATTAFTHQGVTPLLCSRPTPTPVVSWAIPKQGLAGGIILTASHNPPEYNGLKFNPKNGAPAPVETTQVIEELANTYRHAPPEKVAQPSAVETVDILNDFTLDVLKKIESTLPSINLANKSIAIEAKHGTAGPVWETIAKQTGLTHTILHGEARSDFGGLETNPTKLDHLSELISTIQSQNYDLGVAHDPDTDRHVLLDETGTPLTPEETTAILGLFFKSQGYPVSHYITTLASSGLIKALATQQEAQFIETAVGFKYFASPLESARSRNELAFAVESSGGFSSSEHTLEKCGFYPALLMLCCLEHTQKPLSQLRFELKSLFGEFVFLESEFQFEPTQKENLKTNFTTATVETLQSHFEHPIESIDQRDGLKINFQSGEWLLLRLSGTEPIARIYAESGSKETSDALITAGSNCLKKFI